MWGGGHVGTERVRCWDIWGWDVGKGRGDEGQLETGRVGCGGHKLGGMWGYLIMGRVEDGEYLGTGRVECRDPWGQEG